MDERTKAIIERFTNDRELNKVVYDVLLDIFTKPRKGLDSVEEKAAAWISIGQLQEAWKQLDNLKTSKPKVGLDTPQVGM